MTSNPASDPPESNGRTPTTKTACQTTGQGLVDQRLFVVDSDQARSFLDLLERPAEDNAGLSDLFSRPEPWET